MVDDVAIELTPDNEPDPATGDVEIKLDDKPEAKKPDAFGGPQVTEDQAISDLKAQVEKTRADRARDIAAKDREIAAAQQRVQQAEHATIVTRRDAVTITVDNLKQATEAAKRDLKQAYEAGDWTKVAEAQEQIAMAAARIVEAERGKAQLENAARQQPNQQPADPVEAIAQEAERRGSPRSAQWLRAHPEQAKQYNKLTAAHNYAVDLKGAAVDSDEYFRLVEQSFGLEPEGRNPDPPPITPARPKPPQSAQVIREAPTMSGKPPDNNTVSLSGKQVEAALMLNLDEKLDPTDPADKQKILVEYARNMRKLDKEKPGWSTPNYNGQG